MAETYRARVNDSWEFPLSPSDLSDLDLIKTGDQTFHLIKDNRSQKVTIERSKTLSTRYTVTMERERFVVDLDTPLDLFIEEMGFASASEDEVNKVVAPMPGLLLTIYVEAGEEVEKDQPLLVLEAMKMENVILSPRKGTVSAILESQGQTVEKGTSLISFK